MTNPTTLMYNAVKTFTDARTAAVETYQKRMQALTDMKGSKYFIDEKAKAVKARDLAIEQARLECRKSLSDTFKIMRENNAKRGMKPPTEEQLRTLQMLQMRQHITETELQAAANAMNGNGSALQVVQEIARKHGLHGIDYRTEANDFSIQQAADEIDRLASACNRIMETSAKRAAYLGARKNHEWHGTEFDEYALPQEEPFKSANDFSVRMGYGDRLRNAVAG
jgi:hypothetical protein